MNPQQLSALIPLLVFVLLFFFFVWRPQATQMRRRREMLRSLREGDRIVTVGGLYATIDRIKDEELTLELAPNVKVKADRSAVQTVRSRQQAKATQEAQARRRDGFTLRRLPGDGGPGRGPPGIPRGRRCRRAASGGGPARGGPPAAAPPPARRLRAGRGRGVRPRRYTAEIFDI